MLIPRSIHTHQEILSTGDVVCFDSLLSVSGPGSTTSTTSAKWTTSDVAAIRVHEKSGVAVVHAVMAAAGEPHSKRVLVTNQDAVTALQFDVDVRQADTVEFMRPTENFNGRDNTGGEHRSYAILKHRQQGLKLSNVIARNVTRCVNRLLPDSVDAASLFSCHILGDSASHGSLPAKLASKIKARAGFSASHGQYYCGVSLAEYDQEWVPYLRKHSPTLLLELRLANGVMATAELRVVAGMHVAVDRIRFAKESDTPEFTVIGREAVLKEVRVTASHAHLEVKRVATSATGQESEFAVRYQVRVTGSVDEATVLSVTVDSPSTEQVVTLPVEWPSQNVCASRPFTGENLFSSVLSLGVIISTVIVTLTIGYSEYLPYQAAT